MKNAIVLPSVSSQLYSFGNNNTISDVNVQMDNKVNNFCIDSKVLYYDHDNGQFDCGGFAFPSQSSIDYQSGPSASSPMTIERLDYPYLGDGSPTTTSSFDNISQQPLYLSKKISVPQFEASKRARKGAIEVSNIAAGIGYDSLVSNRPTLKEWRTNKEAAICLQERWHAKEEPKLTRPTLKEWTTNKEATISLQEHWHATEETREIQRHRSMPGRRSQKLSDRITTLQKLVSPYGKTDTASVLHEASVSIKVLQDQMQNLFQMLSTSYNSSKPLHSQKTGEKQHDLHSRGLCLVPISFTQKLTKAGQLDHHAAMRKTFI